MLSCHDNNIKYTKINIFSVYLLEDTIRKTKDPILNVKKRHKITKNKPIKNLRNVYDENYDILLKGIKKKLDKFRDIMSVRVLLCR